MKSKPLALRLAVVLGAIEVLSAAAVTVFFAYGLISNQANDLVALLTIVLLLAATTGFLAAATFALHNLNSWGRSALIFWQFLQISLGWGTLEGETGIPWLAALIFLVSGVTAVILFSRPIGKLFEGTQNQAGKKNYKSL
jgi:hypothetical protein